MPRSFVVAGFALVAASALADDAAAIFKAKCASCHGADGKGETPIAKTLKVKTLVHISLSAAQIDKIIAEGKPGTKMMAVKSLSPEQRQAVAAYVKGLK